MNQHWHWQTWQNYSYLTCDLLSPWQHGFFTQEFYPRTPEDLTSIWRSPITSITAYRVKQIHGNLVLTPQEITDILHQQDDADKLAEADAIISDRPQQSVWAASADCTPVLIGDVVTGQVCAIHAGWRGTAQKIVPQAIARFLDFGSEKSNLRIAIGPAISGKMYQVDERVAIEVTQTIMPDNNLEPETILSKLKQLPNVPILDDQLSGKVRLNVPRVNQIQLEQLGINLEQIAIAPYCTFQSQDLFFSYRRTGEKKVQWSGIVSK
jgi:YfiH family protein